MDLYRNPIQILNTPLWICKEFLNRSLQPPYVFLFKSRTNAYHPPMYLFGIPVQIPTTPLWIYIEAPIQVPNIPLCMYVEF